MGVMGGGAGAALAAGEVEGGEGGGGVDGMEGVERSSARLQFATDLRLREVRRLLSSAVSRPVRLPRGMDASHPEAGNMQVRLFTEGGEGKLLSWSRFLHGKRKSGWMGPGKPSLQQTSDVSLSLFLSPSLPPLSPLSLISV